MQSIGIELEALDTSAALILHATNKIHSKSESTGDLDFTTPEINNDSDLARIMRRIILEGLLHWCWEAKREKSRIYAHNEVSAALELLDDKDLENEEKRIEKIKLTLANKLPEFYKDYFGITNKNRAHRQTTLNSVFSFIEKNTSVTRPAEDYPADFYNQFKNTMKHNNSLANAISHIYTELLRFSRLISLYRAEQISKLKSQLIEKNAELDKTTEELAQLNQKDIEKSAKLKRTSETLIEIKNARTEIIKDCSRAEHNLTALQTDFLLKFDGKLHEIRTEFGNLVRAGSGHLIEAMPALQDALAPIDAILSPAIISTPKDDAKGTLPTAKTANLFTTKTTVAAPSKSPGNPF